MKREEMDVMASELAKKAAGELKKFTPDNIDDIHLPSFQAGMRFARDAFIETLKVTAEACRRMGRDDAAKAFEVSANSMRSFPIVGEASDEEECH